MVVDGLVMQGTRTSAAMILIDLSKHILASAPVGLNVFHQMEISVMLKKYVIWNILKVKNGMLRQIQDIKQHWFR